MNHNKTLLLALGLLVSMPLLAKKKDSLAEIELGQSYLRVDDFENALKHFERAIKGAHNPYEEMQARLAIVQMGLEILGDEIAGGTGGDAYLMPMVNAYEARLHVVQANLHNPARRSQSMHEASQLLNCISVDIDPITEAVEVNFTTSIDGNGFGIPQGFMLPNEANSLQLIITPDENEDDMLSDKERFAKKIATLKLSKEAKTEAKRQLKRLETLPPESPETHVVSQYLDWLLALPWGIYTDDNVDLKHCLEVLDNDHYGLDEIKDRILDFLAVRAHCENPHATIICFVGPPGTGKTSIGKSIAKAMGRNFERISVGGVHDESEIRGHRSTYVGAMPGKIIKAMKKAGSMNPVLLVDEIDKMGGSSHRGDPSAAMLEVLDPEQNDSFGDHYLDVPLDLSKVLFITTANKLEEIPGPLRDRMEIIEFSGYTINEKVEIARHHLLPQARKGCGLEDHEVTLKDEVIEQVIAGYTREAGVRELRRVISKLCAKYTRALLEKDETPTFATDNLKTYLGPEYIKGIPNLHNSRVGVTNGLAWTPYGGEILQVEAVLMPGKGKMQLTGKLGDVMKESAQAALTYTKAHAKEYGIPKERFTEYDLHVHVPAGAVPKDGPSAGVTMITSIVSAYTGRPVDARYAMTGEINLNGNVLPIGGLKEKVLAAKQEGITNILAPALNAPDLEKMGEIAEGMNLTLVEEAEEVLDYVLLKRLKNTIFNT